jgi:hypothetical protein
VIRLVPSDALGADEVAALRQLFDEAWGDDADGFTDQDWSHAVGGVHVIAETDACVVAHASAELVRTAEEDGNVLVRLTPTSPELDLSAPISCDWRPGDVW